MFIVRFFNIASKLAYFGLSGLKLNIHSAFFGDGFRDVFWAMVSSPCVLIFNNVKFFFSVCFFDLFLIFLCRLTVVQGPPLFSLAVQLLDPFPLPCGVHQRYPSISSIRAETLLRETLPERLMLPLFQYLNVIRTTHIPRSGWPEVAPEVAPPRCFFRR